MKCILNKEIGENLDLVISEKEMNVWPLSYLVEKEKIGNNTILHIDVEGFEIEVFAGLDWAKFKPKIILFEMKHMSQSNLESLIAAAVIEGYLFLPLEDDGVLYR